MTTTEHPITPPPELVQQWWEKADQHVDRDDPKTYFDHVATQAARWGADQELEACCEYLRKNVTKFTGGAHLFAQRKSDELRAARRPKPPTLKEQALANLYEIYTSQSFPVGDSRFNCIRLALEALDD